MTEFVREAVMSRELDLIRAAVKKLAEQNAQVLAAYNNWKASRRHYERYRRPERLAKTEKKANEKMARLTHLEAKMDRLLGIVKVHKSPQKGQTYLLRLPHVDCQNIQNLARSRKFRQLVKNMEGL